MMKKFTKYERKSVVLKRTMATAMAFSLLLGSTATVTAADTSGGDVSGNAANTQVAEEQVYGIVDEAKSPRQLNVHVGNDASSQVNITYTTVADTDTIVKLNKVGDSENVIYFQGTSVEGISGKYIHEIAVSGLEAYTDYEYTVGDGFNSKSGTFRTALAQNDTRKFTFAYIADIPTSESEPRDWKWKCYQVNTREKQLWCLIM